MLGSVLSGNAAHALGAGPLGCRLPWSAMPDQVGTLVVEAFDALSTDAYRALWSLLTDST